MVDAVNNNHSIVKGTMVAGGIGASVVGGYEYLCQRRILKNPQQVIDRYEQQIKDLAESGKFPKFRENLQNHIEKFLKPLIKDGKISWKGVGKMGAIGAVAVAGVYLLCRGIKALFSKKD